MSMRVARIIVISVSTLMVLGAICAVLGASYSVCDAPLNQHDSRGLYLNSGISDRKLDQPEGVQVNTETSLSLDDSSKVIDEDEPKITDNADSMDEAARVLPLRQQSEDSVRYDETNESETTLTEDSAIEVGGIDETDSSKNEGGISIVDVLEPEPLDRLELQWNSVSQI